MKHFIIFIIIATLLSSCGISGYVPQSPAVPMLNKAGDVRIKASISYPEVSGYGAVALTDNIIFVINGNENLSNFKGRYVTKDDYDEKHKYTETSIGYYNHVNNFYYDIYGGFGIGKGNFMKDIYTEKYNGRFYTESHYSQFHLQGNAGFKFNKFNYRKYESISLTLRLDNTDLEYSYNINEQGYVPDQKFNSVGVYFLYRVGFEHFQLEIMPGINRNINTYDTQVKINFGVSYNLNKR